MDFFLVIDLYDDRVVYNTIGDIDLGNNQFVYSWCKYILEIKKTKKETYEFVLALCTANLLKNTLFYTSTQETTQSSLKIYLDTPMIFALLGMDTQERKKSYTYILDRAKQAGMQLCVFDHNFEEATGIMERAAHWATSCSYDSSKANKVAEFFHDSGMSEDEAFNFIDEAETELNSLGITKEVSAYLAEEDGFQADEESRTYFCIDMKCFFASVECAERGLNPFETNLVVADETRGRNALCLAISPKMKTLGVKNRCRMSEIPKSVKYIVA